MSKKLICLVTFVFVFGLVSNASAVVVAYWDDGGTDDHLWSTADNWSNDLVTTTDTQCRINAPAATSPDGPLIDGGTHDAINVIMGWAAGSVELTIDSGTLNAGHGGTGNGMTIGHSLDSVAVLTMNGGTLNVDGAEFRIAFQDSTGYLYVNGGATVTSTTTMHVAWNAWKTTHQTRAYVHLNDGVINVAGLSFESDPGADGILEGTMYIDTAGTLIVDGDVTADIIGYIDADNIIGKNGQIVHFDYDNINAGKTTVWVPEPATIALLGLGGLFLRKRR